jgi:VWFA-related protein
VVAQQPTFRAATHYVTLDVLVTDHDDRPVLGLTKDDFRITEGGRRQQIADFTHVSIPVGERTINLDAPPPIVSDVATNAGPGPDSRAIVIVVDDTVLDTADIVWIKRVLGTMLGTFSANDQVAFTYVRRSDLGQDFTNDAAEHVRSVNKLTDAMGLPAMSRRFPAQDLLITLQNVVDTLAAARHSRRAIVLIGTRGCSPRGTGTRCLALVDRANEIGVPIYAIDPTGTLDRPFIDDPLRLLTIATGGVLYRESQPWQSPARVMTDNGSYYLLGYYPTPLPADGKFHDVTVEVNRPGMVVRARRGYRAPGGKTKALSPHQEMTASLGKGLPDPGIPIRAFVAPVTTGPRDTTRVLVTVDVAYPIPEGGFSGAFEDEWRVGILALDPDGRIKASFQRPLTFAGTWLPNAQGTFTINETIDVPAQPLTFRVGVSSTTLAKSGSAHIKVAVPDFRDSDVRLGAVVLGVDQMNADATVGVDRIRELVPFQPTAERAFSREETLRIFATTSWRSGPPEASVTIALTGPSSLPDTTIQVLGDQTAGRNLQTAVEHSLSLADLESGDYVLTMTVAVEGRSSVTRAVRFQVR